MDLGMTVADLCTMYKPWELHQELVFTIMEEFWQQVIRSTCKMVELFLCLFTKWERLEYLQIMLLVMFSFIF